MKFSIRELVYIGLFGALWGAVEVGLGSVWHVVNVPYSGAILSAIGISIALIGRLFVPRRGSVLAIGIVTIFLKMFSVGGVVLSPMIGIFAESLIAEITLSILGQPRRIAFMVACALATFWTLVHPLFTQGILAGEGLLKVYLRTLDKGAKLLGLDPNALVIVLVVIVVLHLAIGSVAGFAAWDIGRLVQSRLHPTLRTRQAA